MLAQDHSTYAGRTAQVGHGLLQATTAQPILVTMRSFTSPKNPVGCFWGPHQASASDSPSQERVALTLHQARSVWTELTESHSCVISHQRRDRKVPQGMSTQVVVRECRNPPLKLLQTLSQSRRKKQSFTLSSNTMSFAGPNSFHAKKSLYG